MSAVQEIWLSNSGQQQQKLVGSGESRSGVEAWSRILEKSYAYCFIADTRTDVRDHEDIQLCETTEALWQTSS